MVPRRPPDILRKSHAHSAGKTRASDKRELERNLAESIDEPTAVKKSRGRRSKQASS
jgi:hypothetical protein